MKQEEQSKKKKNKITEKLKSFVYEKKQKKSKTRLSKSALSKTEVTKEI